MPIVKTEEQRNLFGMAHALQKDKSLYKDYKQKYGKPFADKLMKIAFGGKGKTKNLKPFGRNKLRAAASVDNSEVPKKVGSKADIKEHKVLSYEEYLNEFLNNNE